MDGESETLNRCQNVEDKHNPVKLWHLCFSLIGVTAYICDIFSDIYVASKILILSQYMFFIAILIFTILPLSISALTSYAWYPSRFKFLDCARRSLIARFISFIAFPVVSDWEIWYRKDRENLTKWDIFLHWILLAPLIRYFNVFNYARKSYYAEDDSEKKRFQKIYLERNADIALLAVMEAFLEAEPQLIIQLSLIMPKNTLDSSFSEWDRILSIALSIVSVSFAIANFHVAIRRSQDKKRDISCKGLVCQFLWHLLITVSRVISLSCLVFVCPYFALGGYILHVFVVFIYFFKWGPQNIHYGMHFIMACINVFVAISMRDGRTRKFYSVFYTVYFFENIACISFWYWKMDGSNLTLLMIPLSVISFFMGIFFMVLYYQCFHPNKLYSPQRQSSNQPQEEM